jgi:hypothetical protein
VSAPPLLFFWALNECGGVFAHTLQCVSHTFTGVGRPKLSNTSTPIKLQSSVIGQIVKVACGSEFSMVLNAYGELYAFGHPDKGCLGNGTNGERAIAVVSVCPVACASECIFLCLGRVLTVGLTACWVQGSSLCRRRNCHITLSTRRSKLKDGGPSSTMKMS